MQDHSNRSSAHEAATVVIADDHTLVGEAIAGLFHAEQGYSVTGMVDSYDGVISALAKAGNHVDLLLLDLRMPGMQGLTSLADILSRNTGKTVIFSGHAEAQLVREALKLGIAGFIPKTIPLHSVKGAIDLIMSGQVFVPMNLMMNDRSELDLSDVERMVLSRLAEGASNKAIAAELGLPEGRIKMHVRQICQQLAVENRTQAALAARDLGIS